MSCNRIYNEKWIITIRNKNKWNRDKTTITSYTIKHRRSRNSKLAIFVSSSIFYAGYDAYSEWINFGKERYSVIIEVRVKPMSYTYYNSTVLKYVKIDGESIVNLNIELRLKITLILLWGLDLKTMLLLLIFIC